MSLIKTITSGPFQTNSYLVGAEDAPDMILIDAPPDSHAPVMRYLKKNNRSLAAVLITHPHFDHTLDTGLFAQDGIPVYAHEDAVSGIEKPDTLGLVSLPSGGFPAGGVTNLVAGGEIIHLAGLDIQVREVPGHSHGSLAFHIEQDESCFAGDVLFQGSIGRTDLPGGDFDVLAESIQTQIYTLPDNVEVYPGHGPSTNVGTEKRSNPYVRG